MNDKNTSLLIKHYPFLILLIILSASFFRASDRALAGVIWSDAEGYYLYLPAVFIYGGFEGIPYRTKVQFGNYPGTDKLFTKYTCGVAIMELPFFLGAHLFAKLNGTMPADGFSAYYRYGIMAAAAFYAFAGVFFLKRVLERYFPAGIALLTIACLFFGTNLYYYTVGEPGMSHIYSFFLFALFMYLTPRFYHRPEGWIIPAMGMLAGLIVLIRPTNAVLLLYLFLFDVDSWKSLRDRLGWWLGQWRRWWPLPLCFLMVFIHQLWYWKYLSGNFLLYSYGEEGFSNWRNPRLMHVLFDITNGWLLFSPIAVFALAGMYSGCCRLKYDIPVITLITGIAIYAFASWWMWYFGGAFGYRPMVEFYALLAIPFAYQSSRIYGGTSAGDKVLFSIALAMMVYYTLGLTVYKDGPHYTWRSWYSTLNQLIPYWEIKF